MYVLDRCMFFVICMRCRGYYIDKLLELFLVLFGFCVLLGLLLFEWFFFKFFYILNIFYNLGLFFVNKK